MALTHALSDLAAHPEHVGALRDEARAAMAEGAGGSNFTKDVVAKLAKLDSFMRESQRLSPPTTGLTTFHRMCLRDVTLSDSTFLPSGTTIAVDASQRYGDPDLLDHPDQFDGFRFYRLHERANAGRG